MKPLGRFLKDQRCIRRCISRISLLLVLFSVALLTVSSCAAHTPPPVGVTGKCITTIFKIGKADAILIRTQNKTVLVDAGEEEDGYEIASYLQQQNIDYLDIVVATHFDKDHIGGMPVIFNTFEVGTVYQPNYEKKSSVYQAYTDAMQKAGITPTVMDKKRVELTLDDVAVTLYPPLETYYSEDNDNDHSIVTSIKHGDVSILLAADAMAARIDELIEKEVGPHTFLKVPYHGNYIKNLDLLLDEVSPRYAAITCSTKNPPDPDVVAMLQERGITQYLTQNGNITVVSDGANLYISQ